MFHNDERDFLNSATDIWMGLAFSAKERTLHQLNQLIETSGLKINRVIETPSVSTILEVVKQ